MRVSLTLLLSILHCACVCVHFELQKSKYFDIQANQLSDIMCRGAVVSSIQSANNTLTRGVSLHSRSGSAHGSIHGGGSHHGSHGAVGPGSAHGSMGCLQGSTGHLVNVVHGSSGSVGMLAGGGAIDTGDYDVPHPHPYTHHYMQTSTSITPPHSTMSLIGSRPGSAGPCPGHDSGSDSSQGCGGSIMASGGGGGGGMGGHLGHMTAHMVGMAGAHHTHSGGSGSLGRCSSRCHNTTTTTDDSGGGSGGSVFGSGPCMGGLDQAVAAAAAAASTHQHHHIVRHGSAGSGLNGCSSGGSGGRNSSLSTIHNGHGHHQYHHECIHYERLPIPVPIPTVPTTHQQLQSEEEIEPAYATGKAGIMYGDVYMCACVYPRTHTHRVNVLKNLSVGFACIHN